MPGQFLRLAPRTGSNNEGEKYVQMLRGQPFGRLDDLDNSVQWRRKLTGRSYVCRTHHMHFRGLLLCAIRKKVDSAGHQYILRRFPEMWTQFETTMAEWKLAMPPLLPRLNQELLDNEIDHIRAIQRLGTREDWVGVETRWKIEFRMLNEWIGKALADEKEEAKRVEKLMESTSSDSDLVSLYRTYRANYFRTSNELHRSVFPHVIFAMPGGDHNKKKSFLWQTWSTSAVGVNESVFCITQKRDGSGFHAMFGSHGSHFDALDLPSPSLPADSKSVASGNKKTKKICIAELDKGMLLKKQCLSPHVGALIVFMHRIPTDHEKLVLAYIDSYRSNRSLWIQISHDDAHSVCKHVYSCISDAVLVFGKSSSFSELEPSIVATESPQHTLLFPFDELPFTFPVKIKSKTILALPPASNDAPPPALNLSKPPILSQHHHHQHPPAPVEIGQIPQQQQQQHPTQASLSSFPAQTTNFLVTPSAPTTKEGYMLYPALPPMGSGACSRCLFAPSLYLSHLLFTGPGYTHVRSAPFQCHTPQFVDESEFEY